MTSFESKRFSFQHSTGNNSCQSRKVEKADCGKILNTLEVTALKTKACCLSNLSFSDRKACSGSQLLQVLVQQVLLLLCCIAWEVEHQHLKLTCFAPPRGPLGLSLTMALVCCTACELKTCLQLCLSMEALLCSAAPHERCNGFPWRTSYLQQGVPVVLLCCVAQARPLSRVLTSGVGVCRFRFRILTFAPSCNRTAEQGS